MAQIVFIIEMESGDGVAQFLRSADVERILVVVDDDHLVNFSHFRRMSTSMMMTMLLLLLLLESIVSVVKRK